LDKPLFVSREATDFWETAARNGIRRPIGPISNLRVRADGSGFSQLIQGRLINLLETLAGSFLIIEAVADRSVFGFPGDSPSSNPWS
jgi:hypothetical protein